MTKPSYPLSEHSNQSLVFILRYPHGVKHCILKLTCEHIVPTLIKQELSEASLVAHIILVVVLYTVSTFTMETTITREELCL